MESLLPEGFKVALEELCPNQAQPATQKKGPSRRSKPRAEPKPAKAAAKLKTEPTECVQSSTHTALIQLKTHNIAGCLCTMCRNLHASKQCRGLFSPGVPSRQCAHVGLDQRKIVMPWRMRQSVLLQCAGIAAVPGSQRGQSARWRQQV